MKNGLTPRTGDLIPLPFLLLSSSDFFVGCLWILFIHLGWTSFRESEGRCRVSFSCSAHHMVRTPFSLPCYLNRAANNFTPCFWSFSLSLFPCMLGFPCSSSLSADVCVHSLTKHPPVSLWLDMHMDPFAPKNTVHVANIGMLLQWALSALDLLTADSIRISYTLMH